MIDLEYFMEVSWIVFLAMLFPIFWLGISLIRNKQVLSIERRKLIQFLAVSLGLSTLIFIILIFLTGGINSYYFLQTGFFLDERALVWNVTRHLKIIIPYNPGSSLFGVSILSGFVYGGLLTFPPYCEIDTSTDSKKKTSISESLQTTTTSSASTVIASSSALASGVVCCSTSIVAFISPAFATILAPIAPFLIIISLALLNFTLIKQVLPRLPKKSIEKEESESFVDFSE
jgi:hypothetical protein